MNTASAQRTAFFGVAQIVRFNWPRYVIAVVALVAAIVLGLSIRLPDAVRILLIMTAIPVAWWTIASLAVSHWVYDRSRLCRWDWIAGVAPSGIETLVNIHSGYDDTSNVLSAIYPAAKLRVLDIYDASEMSEPSIARARAHSRSEFAPEHADYRSLDVASSSVELITLLLAAHEIRRPESRVQFFSELRRILARDGCIILAEHLRDLPNFIAFGPGFMHFHSRRTWLQSMQQAGLTIVREFSITPFIRIFVLRSDA